MTVRGNGNMLLYPRTFMGKEASCLCPSKHLNTDEYKLWLDVASVDELEHDVLLMSTRSFIRENT